MSDDRLPPQTVPVISENLRQRGIYVLQGFLASGKVDLNRFQSALDGLLSARTHAEFAAVICGLPPPVEFTPAAQRRQEPLVIYTGSDNVRLDGRWQAGHLTRISTGMGNVRIDRMEAEFDDWDLEISVEVNFGSITVIAPSGIDIRLVRTSAAVKSTLEQPIPGFPVVRLSTACGWGKVRLTHPKDKRQRRDGTGGAAR